VLTSKGAKTIEQGETSTSKGVRTTKP